EPADQRRDPRACGRIGDRAARGRDHDHLGVRAGDPDPVADQIAGASRLRARDEADLCGWSRWRAAWPPRPSTPPEAQPSWRACDAAGRPRGEPGSVGMQSAAVSFVTLNTNWSVGFLQLG